MKPIWTEQAIRGLRDTHIVLAEHHHSSDSGLLTERLGYCRRLFSCDSRNICKPLRAVLNYVKGILTKSINYFKRGHRTNALYRAGRKILEYSVNVIGQTFVKCVEGKLLAKLLVPEDWQDFP